MKQHLKKTLFLIVLILSSIPAFSQVTVTEVKHVAEFPAWAMDPLNYLILLIFSILALSVYVLYKVNLTLLEIVSPGSTELVKLPSTVSKKNTPSLFMKAYLKMVDSVPVDKEKDVLLDHDYDGIKELDNNLPPWWKYGFYFTIVFSFVYMLYYHASGSGKLQLDEYKAELAFAAQQKEERLKASADNVNEENVVILTDAEAIAHGKETFSKFCVACHKADGGGMVGPNLTDEYWIHGGGIKNVFKVITYGVPNKGMLSWQSQLSPKQIQQAASYILTLQGTNPQGGKEPQGEKWIDEVIASAAQTPHSSDSAITSIDQLKK
jgi:cytochrome c oxidase cbb3-type subunit III